MKRFAFTLITLLAACYAATAQDLDIYHADFIDDGPNRAILKRDFFYSPQWQAFEERVQGRFIYGERDGVNYILSAEDGSEIGTFKMTDTAHEVNYYPGKGLGR